MDDADEFRREILSRARVRAAADQNLAYSSFVEVCGDFLEDAEEIYDFTPCFYRRQKSGARNLAVDGYGFDEADQSARIVVADYSGENAPSALTGVDSRRQFAELQAFVEEAISGQVAAITEDSSPEHGLARELKARAPEVSRYRLYLVSDRSLSTRIKDWPEGQIGGKPVEFHIWDISRFHRAYQSRTGRDELVVEFGEMPSGGLPCLPASMKTEAYEGYLCTISGTALADIYDTYGSRLLEGNVRAFLSPTGKVNKGIQQTLGADPEMFFAYNNGIAATASAVEIRPTAKGLEVISATDFQIVNGGQTTASMSYARRKNAARLDGVIVPMKISVVDEERAGAFIPLISRYSNYQNKVSDADFFANHEFHRRIEKISRRLRAPAMKGSQVETFWFYERARGQYAVELGRLSASERKRFEIECPREQILTKTDVAKIENSWRQLPHEVSRGAQKNFLKFAEFASSEWEKDPEAFHDTYYKGLIAHTIMFRALERLIPSQTWYEGGYRANIVTYALSKLANMIGARGGPGRLDLQRIWKGQELPQVVTDQLLAIAKAVYGVILAPEAGIQNITEWCKKELAWQRVQALRISFEKGFEDQLLDPEDSAAGRRDAKVEGSIDAGMEAVQEVLAFGADKWASLRNEAVKRSAATPREADLMRVASNPKWVPTDRQAKDLVKLLTKFRGENIVQ